MPIKWNTYEQINHRFAGLQLKCVIFSRVNSILMGFLHLILNVQRQPSKSTKRHVFISPQKTAISMAHSKCQSCEFVVGLLVWSRCTGSIFEVFFCPIPFRDTSGIKNALHHWPQIKATICKLYPKCKFTSLKYQF